MRAAPVVLLCLAGCASAPPPQTSYTVPPSLGPKIETEYVQEKVDPALRSPKGLRKNQATMFLYEDDRVYDIKACSAGRFTNIKLPPGEELTGDTIAAFGDTDPQKWGIFAKKGGKTWVVSVGGRVPGLETSMTLTTNAAAYPFDIVSSRQGCHKIVSFVRPRMIAVKREVEPAHDESAVNGNYVVSLEKGDRPGWMPTRAFDVGTQKVWVEFPGPPGTVGTPAVVAGGSPITPRIDGNFYQVDTALSSFELRLNGSIVSVEKGAS